MDLCEQLVLEYLTKDAYVFVSPQYSLRDESNHEWSCPDYVALDFKQRAVTVVEVSSAQGPRPLRERVRRRDHHWLEKLRGQLKANHVVDDTWNKYFVDVYVRKNAAERFNKEFGGDPQVRVCVLEDLKLPWEWVRSFGPEK